MKARSDQNRKRCSFRSATLPWWPQVVLRFLTRDRVRFLNRREIISASRGLSAHIKHFVISGWFERLGARSGLLIFTRQRAWHSGISAKYFFFPRSDRLIINWIKVDQREYNINLMNAAATAGICATGVSAGVVRPQRQNIWSQVCIQKNRRLMLLACHCF